MIGYFIAVPLFIFNSVAFLWAVVFTAFLVSANSPNIEISTTVEDIVRLLKSMDFGQIMLLPEFVPNLLTLTFFDEPSIWLEKYTLIPTVCFLSFSIVYKNYMEKVPPLSLSIFFTISGMLYFSVSWIFVTANPESTMVGPLASVAFSGIFYNSPLALFFSYKELKVVN